MSELFDSALVITATAVATHPEGAEVPPPFPNPAAVVADSDEE